MTRYLSSSMLLFALLTVVNAQITISIGWDQPQLFKSNGPALKTVPTLQVVSNPLLKRDTVTHDSAYAELRRLQGSYVRFVAWYAFGDAYSIVETQAPSNGKTYYDFSYIDPLVIDFMNAQGGRSVIMNFSTIPVWVLQDTSYALLGDYYSRLLSWYEAGGFTDELGVFHASGYHYKFDYWEAFNEPDLEGNVSAADYCRRYDTLVTAMRRVDSTIKFCGPAMSSFNYAFYRYFLDPKNHKSGIPIDMISYHWYGTTDDYFTQAENEQIPYTYACNALRDSYRPDAKTDCDEMGTFSSETGFMPTDPYWCYSGAVFAFQYGQMCLARADIAGMSQLMAQPGYAPDVSMLDWNTGRANARARVLELLTNTMAPGDSLVTAAVSDTSVFVLGFITSSGQHKALVVNKTADQITLVFPQNVTDVQYVDVTTNQAPVATGTTVGVKQLTMNAYAVWVATLAPVPVTFTPAPGMYFMSASLPFSVSLTPDVAQNAIYYTTDGSNPTTSSKQYTGPITITDTTVIKALEAGNSEIVAGTYTNGTPQISNGSFETPNVGAGNYTYRVPGAGWNLISQSGISGNKSGFTWSNPDAPDSSQVLFLQDYGRAQQFVTMNAGSYTLSLSIAQRANYQTGEGQTVVVSVDGKEAARIKPSSTSYMAYTTDTFAVTSGQHLIELRGLDLDDADNTAFVDMVSLSMESYISVHHEESKLKTSVVPIFFSHGAIRMYLGDPGDFRASLLSINGRVVASWSQQVKRGAQTVLMLPTGLTPGVYLFKSIFNDKQISKKVLLSVNAAN